MPRSLTDFMLNFATTQLIIRNGQETNGLNPPEKYTPWVLVNNLQIPDVVSNMINYFSSFNSLKYFQLFPPLWNISIPFYSKISCVTYAMPTRVLWDSKLAKGLRWPPQLRRWCQLEQWVLQMRGCPHNNDHFNVEFIMVKCWSWFNKNWCSNLH